MRRLTPFFFLVMGTIVSVVVFVCLEMTAQIENVRSACLPIFGTIGALTLAVLIYSNIQFRRSRDTKVQHFHQHMSTEILWTVLPALILIALVAPATLYVLQWW